jgi:hypothetical protein
MEKIGPDAWASSIPQDAHGFANRLAAAFAIGNVVNGQVRDYGVEC